MEYFSATFVSLLTQAPILLIWIIGIVLSIILWRKHPAVSALTLIAMGGLIILGIVNTYLNIRLPSLILERSWSFRNTGFVFAFSGMVSSILRAILWVLLIISIFGWRNKKDKG